MSAVGLYLAGHAEKVETLMILKGAHDRFKRDECEQVIQSMCQRDCRMPVSPPVQTLL